MTKDIQQYLIVTGNYWAFTLTDGALRMLVVLYFHQLGYSPLNIALLFLFYEVFGVITNLVGGWLGARFGLNKTMNVGLVLQIVALLMLAAPSEWLTVIYVMAAQALSGIAKDLNKMSAKSSIKMLVAQGQDSQLFKWVALLTGSKNALKGVGFFLGGLLLTTLGFKAAVLIMALALLLVWVFSLYALTGDLGKANHKPKFSQVFSKSRAINILSAARMFLFAARDVWFVVALPVFLATTLGWNHWWVGGFLALWIIGYGAIQSVAPQLLKRFTEKYSYHLTTTVLAAVLALIPLTIAIALQSSLAIVLSVVCGLVIFGIVFALNSSWHSFLIVRYASDDGVSMDVGFYYMANALGRLLGTVLSGGIYQLYGLAACLIVSFCFLLIAAAISAFLPRKIETCENKMLT
ncbi:organoarsenical effux MFS transporter ArsJ [Thalassotalea marina]|uniref:MFS transporter n=1 Tax=Thalassotalea marina TaxID=1673741 RepID=A0A919BPA1_9GAMM|nr:organoarsenical effux MFS transporter ArsJ [Thalassotalea marina]GHG01626.1 MFS transporter [Thalassotalea marina]